MRITDIELTPIRTTRETRYHSQQVIVQIRTDDGVVGIGEMADIRDTMAVPDVDDLQVRLSEALRGSDPMDYAFGRTVVSRYGIAIAAGIEIALYDLRGKVLGVPICQLMGGKYRDRIKVAYPLFSDLSEPTVEMNVARVGKLLDQGFDLFRFYTGPLALDIDEQFFKGAREAYGDRFSFKSLDMSGQFSCGDAAKVINRFEKYGFELVETPCRHIEDTVRLRGLIGLPISEHVHTVDRARQLIDLRACDIFNILVTVGGLEHARKLFYIAEAYGMKTLIGTTQELSIGTAAQAHLGASVPNLDYPSDPSGAQVFQEDVVVERVKYENGSLLVPDGPGLGLELDKDKLEALRRPLRDK